MIVDNTFPLRGWLTCLDTLHELGFNDEEIDKALQIHSITLDMLTSVHRYQKLKHGNELYIMQSNVKIPCILIKTGKLYMQVHHLLDSSYTKFDCVPGYEIREASHYQSNVHARLLKTLLTMRLPWLSLLEWNIYGVPFKAEEVEIYLKNPHKIPGEHSVYCQVVALLNYDKDAIITRNIDYFTRYYASEPKEQLEKRLKMLESPEALKLFEFLDTPQEK